MGWKLCKRKAPTYQSCLRVSITYFLRYSGDQEDKEWLAKNQLMSTTGGKAYLMVLEDILELAQSADMSSHPRHQVDVIRHFKTVCYGYKVSSLLIYRVSHLIVREVSSCFVLGVPLPCLGSS